ncbi:MAG: threonine/serine ThrE exporter family protein [Propionibacteriaceae bacterium]
MSGHEPVMANAGRDAELALKSAAVCRMGAAMLAAGTGSYRVKAAMGRVAQALGVEQIESQVGFNEIVVTIREGDAFRTQIVEVPIPAVNADRIAELLRISLKVTPGLTAAQLHAELDEMEDNARHYRRLYVVLGAALACAAFAFLNNGRWQECLAAAAAAGFGKAVQVFLGKRFKLNPLAVVALASMAASFLYLLAASILRWTSPGLAMSLHEAAFTSAILFLVPGFPLITAGLDLARFDFPAGIARLLYSVLVFMAAALGAWVVAWSFGLAPAEIAPMHIPFALMLSLRAVASFLGIFGFAITFNTPLKAAVATSMIGMVANVLRLTAVDLQANPLLCAIAAAIIIGLSAGWVCQRLAAPRIILSVPAILIMIPGAPTYRALVGMINRDTLGALSNGFFVVAFFTCLVSGLVIARMITDPAWISSTPDWTHMPKTRAQAIIREQVRAERSE